MVILKFLHQSLFPHLLPDFSLVEKIPQVPMFSFRITCFISSLIITFIKKVALILVSSTRPTTLEVFYEAMDHEIPLIHGEIIVRSTCMPIFELRRNYSEVSSRLESCEKVKEQDGYEKCKNSWLNEYLTSNHCNSPIFSNDPDMNSYKSHSFTVSPSSSFMDQEFHCKMASFDECIDSCSQHFEGVTSRTEVLLPRFPEIQPLEGIVNNTTDLLSQSAEIQQFVTRIHPAPYLSLAKSPESISDFILSDTLNTSSTEEEFIHGQQDFEISASMIHDQVDFEYQPAVCRSDLSILSLEQPLVGRSDGVDGDSFHHMYTQRMRFFDVLFQERLYGINAILNEGLSSPSSPTTRRKSQISSQVETKMLLKSLKSDLELVYIAELCLTWESLHYQYRKVEVLTCYNNSQCHQLFCTDVSEKFRKFQILTERYTEDEKYSESKRNANFTYRRCQLQVPDVTGYMEDHISCLREDGIMTNEALEAIAKCIKSFWTYIKTDYKKPLWKFKATLWPHSHPPVEDPKDLQLLYDLTKALHEKEQVVKDLQKKKQSLLKRRVKPVQVEYESIDVLCCAIDVKLVEKVLKMPIVLASHLKWCQEKLNNIEFRDGQVCRDTGASLFPLS